MLPPRASRNAIWALLRALMLPAHELFRVEHLVTDGEVSRPMIAKVLQELAKRGFLEGVRGAGGGYRLVPEVEHRSLMDVVEAIDGPWHRIMLIDSKTDCPCEPWPLSVLLEPMFAQIEECLRQTTLEKLHEIAVSGDGHTLSLAAYTDSHPAVASASKPARSDPSIHS